MFSQFEQRLAALEEQHKDVVSRLQESHFQVSCLRSEILDLKEENAKLRNADIVALQDDVLKLYTEMSELKAENAMLKEPSQLGGNVFVGYIDGTWNALFISRHVTPDGFADFCRSVPGCLLFYINSFVDLPNITQIDLADVFLQKTVFFDINTNQRLIVNSGREPTRNQFNNGVFKEFERVNVKLLYNGCPKFDYIEIKIKTKNK